MTNISMANYDIADNITHIAMPYAIQFRQLALKSPPLGPRRGRWVKKTRVRIQSSSLQSAGMGGSDAHQVFLPTYPTWALVGGTSRPVGETVDIICVDIRCAPGG